MRTETRRFEVTTANGRIFTICEYQTGPGSKEFFTSDGEKVEVKAGGTYEIIGLGVLLRLLRRKQGGKRPEGMS
jgi:hypothetical protein